MDVNIYTPTHTHIHIHIYINSDMVPGIVYQNEECPRSAENKEKRKKNKKTKEVKSNTTYIIDWTQNCSTRWSIGRTYILWKRKTKTKTFAKVSAHKDKCEDRTDRQLITIAIMIPL